MACHSILFWVQQNNEAVCAHAVFFACPFACAKPDIEAYYRSAEAVCRPPVRPAFNTHAWGVFLPVGALRDFIRCRYHHPHRRQALRAFGVLHGFWDCLFTGFSFCALSVGYDYRVSTWRIMCDFSIIFIQNVIGFFNFLIQHI